MSWKGHQHPDELHTFSWLSLSCYPLSPLSLSGGSHHLFTQRGCMEETHSSSLPSVPHSQAPGPGGSEGNDEAGRGEGNERVFISTTNGLCYLLPVKGE